jgi:hypothetical protein
MTHEILLPSSNRTLTKYAMRPVNRFEVGTKPFKSRMVYAAPHVVADPWADITPVDAPAIDWESTLAYRRYLWSLGIAVAEAMDTAQRGMGLNWTATQELIERSVREAKSVGGEIACGAGTDQLAYTRETTLDEVIRAYREQCEFVERHGGKIILMASRALAACAKSADDYDKVYDTILKEVKGKVILHWLGDMFDPALQGYWGHKDIDAAMDVCLGVIKRHTGKIDGIKISLLDDAKEIRMRRRLPPGVRMYTGDDFNYPSLIQGDDQGHSHALLGIFNAIAPAASAAIHALDQGDIERYNQIMVPTVPLSRHIFQKPTFYYKTGVVFLAYLNGHQSHFRMVGGLESARSILHLSQLFQYADEAGVLNDPELAIQRMNLVLKSAGMI